MRRISSGCRRACKSCMGSTSRSSATNWERISAQIEQASQQPARQLQVLTGACAYRKIVLDAYWAPGSDNSHPEIYTPSFRINAFHFGYSPWVTDQDGNSPYALYPRPFITDLDEYLEWVRRTIVEKKAQGCVALKLPIAYDRGLDFADVPYNLAQAAFGRLVSASAKAPNKPQPAGGAGEASAIISNVPVQPPATLPPIADIRGRGYQGLPGFRFLPDLPLGG